MTADTRRKPERHRPWRAGGFLLLLGVLFAPAVAAAPDPVGRVISATGEVTAVRSGATARSLDRGEPVYEGDEVRTGDAARTQIRFIDGGLFALDPETRFAVDRYRADDAGGGSALMRFLQGALRTITGTISGDGDGIYELETPTATIGIRGTAYAVSFCSDDCAQRANYPPGMFGRVDDGGIDVQAPSGPVAFDRGDFFFVPLEGAPRRILRPPEGILDGSALRAAAERASRTIDESGTAAEAESLVDDGARLVDERTVQDALGPVFESADRLVTVDSGSDGGSDGGSDNPPLVPTETGISGFSVIANGEGASRGQKQIFAAATGIRFDTDGAITGATFDTGAVADTDIAQLSTGTVDALEVDWGLWQGDIVVDGQIVQGSLAYTTTNNVTAPTIVQSLTGLIDYQLAGGPMATDDVGDLWNVDALSLGVDFDVLQVGVNAFTLSEDVTGNVLNLTELPLPAQSGPVDVQNGTLSFQGTNAKGGLSLEATFVGLDGEGMIVVFEANDDVGAINVIGTSILQQSDLVSTQQ